MRAVIFREHGGLEKLEYVTDWPHPQIGEEEVLVKVQACALNHLDIFVREGWPALKLPLPHISGCDSSGVLEATGANVKNCKKGDAVIVAPGISCWNCHFCRSGRDNLCAGYGIVGETSQGGFAEFLKVNAAQIIPKPNNISFAEAAAFPLTFLTAWHMLITQARLKEGQSVLVLAAGSGVATAAIQMARWAKAGLIVAAAATENKTGQAKKLGAHETIITGANNAGNFYRQVRRLTKGQGVDIVFEHVGSASLMESIKCLKKGGTVVTCGATSGPQVNIDLRYFYAKEIRLQGSIMGTLEELKTITALVGQKKLIPVIDSTFPLADLGKAQEKMLSRQFFGKIVILQN